MEEIQMSSRQYPLRQDGYTHKESLAIYFPFTGSEIKNNSIYNVINEELILEVFDDTVYRLRNMEEEKIVVCPPLTQY